MKILNIRIYQKDNAIIIWADTIFIKDHERLSGLRIHPALFWQDRLTEKTILQTMQDRFVYPDPKTPVDALKRQDGPKFKFGATLENKRTIADSGAAIYVLPTDPTLALDFLAAFDTFINDRKFDHLQFVDFNFGDKLEGKPDEKTLSGTIEEHVKLGKVVTERSSASKMFAECILSLQSTPPEYEDVMAVIKKVYEYCEEDPSRKFADCLDLKLRFAILMGATENAALLNPNSSVEDRMKLIYALERKFLSEGKKKELDHLFHNLNMKAKYELYEPALHQIAHDKKGKYHYGYTEWGVLKHACFCVRSDGRVSTKLIDNPGYQANYAKGKDNHAIMEEEFRFLGKLIGLEFAEDTNFHDELIFTPACSQKLIAAGLHHNRTYLKGLLKIKNKTTLFVHAQLNETGKENKRCLFYQFPREVIEIILGYAYADLQRGLEAKEMAATRTISWTGKSKETLQPSIFKPKPVFKLETEEFKVVAVKDVTDASRDDNPKKARGPI